MVMLRPHLQDRVTDGHERSLTVKSETVATDPPRLVVSCPVPSIFVSAEPDMISPFGIAERWNKRVQLLLLF